MEKVRSMNKAFGTLKTSFFFMAALLAVVCIVSGFMVFNAYDDASKRIYVVSQNGTFSALASQDGGASIYEIRNHIKTFVNLAFSYDENTFKPNLDNALNLISTADGKILYDQLKRGEVYENLVKLGIRTEAKIDSIFVDGQQEPYACRVYFRQVSKNASGTASAPIGARFEIVKVPRAEVNPHGLQIQKLAFIRYEVNSEEREKAAPEEPSDTPTQPNP